MDVLEVPCSTTVTYCFILPLLFHVCQLIMANTPFTQSDLILYETSFAHVERSHYKIYLNQISELNGIKVIHLLEGVLKRFSFESN